MKWANVSVYETFIWCWCYSNDAVSRVAIFLDFTLVFKRFEGRKRFIYVTVSLPFSLFFLSFFLKWQEVDSFCCQKILLMLSWLRPNLCSYSASTFNFCRTFQRTLQIEYKLWIICKISIHLYIYSRINKKQINELHEMNVFEIELQE